MPGFLREAKSQLSEAPRKARKNTDSEKLLAQTAPAVLNKHSKDYGNGDPVLGCANIIHAALLPPFAPASLGGKKTSTGLFQVPLPMPEYWIFTLNLPISPVRWGSACDVRGDKAE